MAQTLKFGNGVWANKEGLTLAYNDENGNYKPLPFNFTRSTSATRINKQGLIEVVRNNKPRIDYKDSAKGALLLEPSRTNSVTYSENFSQWTANDLTVTDNNAISPSGFENASKLTAAIGSSVKRIVLGSMPTTSAARSFSIFVKTNNISAIQLLHSGDLQGYANFDLSNNTVGSVGSKTTSEIENYGNGWYRCTAIFDNTNVLGSSLYLYIKDNAFGTYGGATSEFGDLFVYGAQYEQSSYPTSYVISNSGSSTTRVAETANGAGNSEVFNDSEGVFFVEMAALANDGTNRIFGISGASGFNDSVVIRYNAVTDNDILAQVRLGGTYQCSLNYFPSDATEFSKVAFQYKANDFKLYAAGALQEADTSGGTITGLENFGFSFVGGNQFYGKIKSVKIYDTALTEAELIAITTL